MLPEQRRAAPDDWWRVEHFDWRSERPDSTERRMIALDDHSPGSNLWVGEDLLVVVDRTAWDIVGLEKRQPFGPRSRDGYCFDEVGEHRSISHALGVIGEAGVGDPLGMTEQIAEPFEQTLIRGSQRHIAVGAPYRLVGSAHPMRRAQRLW